jgi:alkyl sulfatase BDS1-like metallo-beta-lactamase superfamily hydrolase
VTEVDAKNLPVAEIVKPASEASLPVEIAAGVFMSEDVSNSYAVKTQAGALVINTGTLAGGPGHAARYKKAGLGKVEYLILTQHHVDHVGGLQSFLTDKPKIIADWRFPEGFGYHTKLEPYYTPHTKRIWGVVLKDNFPPPTEFSIHPDILVEGNYRLDFGGRHFEIFSTPGGETLDSLCVWMPEEKIVFTGNLFGPAFMTIPNVNTLRTDKPRSIVEYIRNADRVSRLGAELLVTGHGEPIRGAERVAADTAKLRDAVQHIHDETVKRMNEGKPVEQIMQEVTLPPTLQLHEWYGTIPWTVKTIWAEYTGWWDQDYTSKLYPVSPASRYPDIVALAGSGPLAQKAQDYLDAGKTLEGLQLIEILLTGEPKNARGLGLLIEALGVLLAAAGERKNLQETVWLRSELAHAEQRLDESRT